MLNIKKNLLRGVANQRGSALLTEAIIAIFVATIIGVVLATAIANAYKMEKIVRDLSQMQSAQVLNVTTLNDIVPAYDTILYDDSNLAGDNQRLALDDSAGSGDKKYAAITLVDKEGYKPAASGVLGVYYSDSDFTGQDWANTVFTPIGDMGISVADKLQFTVPDEEDPGNPYAIIKIRVSIGTAQNEQTTSINLK